MADVSVSQQDPVGNSAEGLHLVAEVRRGVDEEALPGGRVEQAERGHADAPRGVPPRLGAERLVAAGVRNAPVLRDPEDDGLGAGGGPGGSQKRQEEAEHPALL